MNEFFDENNYNKLFSIVTNNIKEHPNYISDFNLENILKKNMNDIFNFYKQTIINMENKDQLFHLNSHTIQETLPKIISELNNINDQNVATKIESYITHDFIPNNEIKMDPQYMSNTVRNNIDLNKLYQDTNNIDLNNRNSLYVEKNGTEPQDLYKSNNKVKELLKNKQESELNSNQEILDITTRIFNDTSKNRDRYMEEYITISSLDRNMTSYPFLTDSKFVVEFNVDNSYLGANIGKLYKNVIGIELIGVQIPLLFKTTDDTTYGISSYSPLLATGSGTVNTGVDPVTNTAMSQLPYIYLSIEEFNDKNYNSSTNPVFSKITNLSKAGSSALMSPIDGKKVFRKTELKTINRLTIEFLQPNGDPFIFLYGNRSANNFQVANSTLSETSITLDFKITILEPSFNNIN